MFELTGNFFKDMWLHMRMGWKIFGNYWYIWVTIILLPIIISFIIDWRKGNVSWLPASKKRK